jgi:hypothetical protein
MPKASRKAALEALRARRNGLVTSSRTDDYEVQDAEDIYDVVEENEYRDLVERRRERENFVVDDGAYGNNKMVFEFMDLFFLFSSFVNVHCVS